MKPDTSQQKDPANLSDDDLLELASTAMAARFAATGVSTTMTTFDAMNLFMMVGKRLRTVEKQIRPQLRTQIANLGERWREDGKPTAQSVLIDMLVASWDNINDTDEAMTKAFDTALSTSKKPTRAR